MKMIVFGATGEVGRRICQEARRRGHEVTGVVRRTSRLELLPAGVAGMVLDANDSEGVFAAIAEHDLAASALRPPRGSEADLPLLTQQILKAAWRAHKRVLIVGGAANLLLPDASGHTVLSAPDFLPKSHRAIAAASLSQYRICAEDRATDWVYFSPPPQLVPGVRTGRYRRGSDVLLVDEAGESKISMEDFAVAMLDEAEAPEANVRRITVAY